MSDNPPTSEKFVGLTQVQWVALGSLGAVCAFLTFAFGAYQFATSLEAERAKQTMVMVETWRQDKYRDNYLLLADLTAAAINENLTEEDHAFLKANEAARGNAAAKLVPLILSKDPKSKQALDEVVYFFNLLGLCVEAKLCSRRTSADFFDQTLLSFYDIFESEITARQSQRHDYATGLVKLAKRFRD